MPATTTPVLRILIVDDNHICSQLLARIFTTERLKGITTFQLTILYSAEDALRVLETNCYDIIFTDIEMTGMSGDEMVRVIRNESGSILKGNRNIPIIAVTSKYDNESCMQYVEAGITECLQKPAKIESIYTIVERLTNQ
jgi:CheY-like chemotaxis protein